ncbi:MFS transporter [Methylobacterium sp. WSM2598]|uniref:MFS transporter n=1 Tax=Methylobacterium sp. WSM2598 TaxID=398261 RepID=UPI00035CA464|nr:MFS transporter [Methylobacterium sp. WSM2598]
MSATNIEAGRTDAPVAAADHPREVYAKITWRLIPVLFLCYVLAYLDRINVGFAQLQMKSDLGFSDAIYGLGAGIFFVGYFIFEVPSNLLLERIGARKTITRIMVVWGLISAAMASVHQPWLFYLLRFLLGVFEAGFFPGIILYLTYWYPGAYRARVIAIFSSAFAVAGLLGGPLSGWVMNDMAGTWGLKGWQWMFILEGLPTCLMGLFVFTYLDDKPDQARWLSQEEKALVRRNLAIEHADSPDAGRHGLGDYLAAMRDPKIYALSLSYFCFICGVYMISFWLPTLVKEMGVSHPLHVGLLTAIPYSVSVVGMILIGIHSDRRLERRWHCAVPAFVGSLSLIGLVYVQGNMVMSFVLLSIGALGIITTMPQFWAIPTSYLKGSATAGGIAFINSLGLTGGFVSPFVLGWIKTTTGSLILGNWLMAGILALGGAVILVTVRPGLLRETRL